MVHEKVENFPYGLTKEEATSLFNGEDVYDILETFDTLEDSLEFIKNTLGIESYEYALKDSEESIKEEKGFIEYYKSINRTYIGYTSFGTRQNSIGNVNDIYFFGFQQVK